MAAISYPLGYPSRFRETLLADIFTRQSDLVGQANHTGIEIGIRHQLSSRLVLDAGLASELTGPSDRSMFSGTLGLSVGF